MEQSPDVSHHGHRGVEALSSCQPRLNRSGAPASDLRRGPADLEDCTLARLAR